VPLFDYRCSNCCTFKEVIRSLENLSEEIVCSECGEPMEKMISTTNFILRGGGWEKDGYTGKGGSDSAGS
jgi:putative FmdB family regulatory protein